MQLTGGQFKGRKIETAAGARPTLAVVREGIFSSLYSYFGELEGLKMLDLFLGSGIISLEALSRGIEVKSFEINPKIASVAKKNFSNLNKKGTIFQKDSLKHAIKLEEKFDIIYADPPWDYDYTKIFEICAKLLNEEGVALIECDKKKEAQICLLLETIENLALFKRKKYGRCSILYLKLN